MKTKQIIMIGTVTVAVMLGGGVKQSNAQTVMKAETAPQLQMQTENDAEADSDPFLSVLGAAKDAEISDALYQGLSLADIAEANGKHAQDIIDLQVAQLSEQLSLRMKNGQLTPSNYQAQLKELRSIVADSVYGESKDTRSTNDL